MPINLSNNKYLKMLELDKIINDVIKEADLLKAKERLENIELMDGIDDIRLALNEVNEASILLNRYGKYPLYFSNDISINLS